MYVIVGAIRQRKQLYFKLLLTSYKFDLKKKKKINMIYFVISYIKFRSTNFVTC